MKERVRDGISHRESCGQYNCQLRAGGEEISEHGSGAARLKLKKFL